MGGSSGFVVMRLLPPAEPLGGSAFRPPNATLPAMFSPGCLRSCKEESTLVLRLLPPQNTTKF